MSTCPAAKSLKSWMWVEYDEFVIYELPLNAPERVERRQLFTLGRKHGPVAVQEDGTDDTTVDVCIAASVSVSERFHPYCQQSHIIKIHTSTNLLVLICSLDNVIPHFHQHTHTHSKSPVPQPYLAFLNFFSHRLSSMSFCVFVCECCTAELLVFSSCL